MGKVTPLLIAQLSDLHLFATPDRELLGLNTFVSLDVVLQKLKQLPRQPDQLLLTGDLAQDETHIAYQHIQTLIAPLKIPTYWLPGNHDHLPTMQATLTNPIFQPHKSYRMGSWHFLLLDSSVTGKVYGELSPESLSWLDQELDQCYPHPTLIALHHPPFAIKSDWLDQIGLQNSDDLFAIIDRHSHVKLVVFGHIHQQFEHQRHNVHFLSTPSTCIQFAPHSKTFALDQAQPGFRLLCLHGDGTFETEIQRTIFSQTLDFSAKGY
ncbi:3',5'-cyclic-AMP phosphodiesterase [Acaryochloris sp. IP29b_bin.137]|uniref:3',5'-cyclic-AMP phosphodiesterase n=1 Tax=Acaryochloris sp. IP29b_bin.137 TaxID=2969217 RepID=UPI0026248B43|nr:3',5'-cyclic-AMP phosphodiesterase [Acaryochloris sp. IP29b_bin.137]